MAVPIDDTGDDVAQSILAALAFGQCSPELQSSYSRIFSIFQQVDYVGHLDELDLLFAMVNDHNIDSMEVIPALEAILRVSVDKCFESIGVALDGDTPIDMVEDALLCLLQFDATDSPGVFVGIVDAASDSLEALLSILAYVGNYSEDDWFRYVISVSDNTIERVRQIAAKEDERVQSREDTVGTDELNRRISALAAARPDSLGVALAKDNIGVGASMESLYGCHVHRLLDLSTEQAVVELFSLAAISCESYERVDVTVSAALDDLCYDMEKRRVAEQMKGNLLKSFRPIFGVGYEKI